MSEQDEDDIITCGITEFKMDKSDTLDCIKKKVQRYIFDLWWESKKGTDLLYIVNQFDMMTIEEYINADFRGSNNLVEKSIIAAQPLIQ